MDYKNQSRIGIDLVRVPTAISGIVKLFIDYLPYSKSIIHETVSFIGESKGLLGL